MKSYSDIFIDFDDTLYDTHGNADLALREVYCLYDLGKYFDDPNIFFSTYWKVNAEVWEKYAMGEITKDELIVERFKRPLSLGMDSVDDDFCKSINKTFLMCCSDKTGVVPGAHELVDYLREKGYRIHICSNGFHEVQYKKLRSCNMLDKFDSIILSEDAGANKPSGLFFDYAFRMTGAERKSTIMIGDNLVTDMLGARNAGIDTIYFRRKDQPLSDEVMYTVESLEDICKIL